MTKMRTTCIRHTQPEEANESIKRDFSPCSFSPKKNSLIKYSNYMPHSILVPLSPASAAKETPEKFHSFNYVRSSERENGNCEKLIKIRNFLARNMSMCLWHVSVLNIPRIIRAHLFDALLNFIIIIFCMYLNIFPTLLHAI